MFIVITFLTYYLIMVRNTIFSYQINSKYAIFGSDTEDLEFRIAIEPQKMECFYQALTKAYNIEISYQVIEINSRWMYSSNNPQDLIINFFMKDPNEQVLVQEFNKNEGTHLETIKLDGVYSFCFDNRITSTFTKLVNIEVFIYSKENKDRWDFFQNTSFPLDIQYSDTIESIKVSINKVKNDLIKIVHSQDERRTIEKRDRILVEKNFVFINRFSFLSTFVMIVVGLVQLFVIRSLFQKKDYFKKLFKIF